MWEFGCKSRQYQYICALADKSNLKKILKCSIYFSQMNILLKAFLWFHDIFMKINKSELLAKRGSNVGPKSKVAICLWGTCQQFTRISLPTVPLWSRCCCSSDVPTEWWLRTGTVGGDQCNLSLLRALMWTEATASYTDTSLWLGLILLFGNTPCRKWLLEINVPVLNMNQSYCS